MANGSALKVITTVTARSTPKTDTTPATGTSSELVTSLKMMEDAAAAFGKALITDPAARLDYMRKTVEARKELIQLVRDGKITPHEAAKTANAIRNQIMELTRAKLSDFGLALSKDMKAAGRPLDYMEARKAKELFGKAFEKLTSAEKEQVWMKVVESAGRSNPKVNIMVRWFGLAGRGFLVATLGYAVYHVLTAEDKERQAVKEGASFAGGVFGGLLATIGLGAVVSNPAGWVVGAAMFVGAVLGAEGSSEAFDYFWPEAAH